MMSEDPRDQSARVSEQLRKDQEEGKPHVRLRDADCIARRSVRWLWRDRIPRGKVSLVAGNPGLGKSQLAISIAAIVSTGRPWPDGATTNPGRVVICSAEDDAEDTIRPRLEAAGADLSRVSIVDSVVDRWNGLGEEVPRGFRLNHDELLLHNALARFGQEEVHLVVIDPVSAYLGAAVDSHNNTEVRATLTPITELAAQRKVAVLLVSHLNKGGGTEAMTRVIGSIAFTAAARAAYLVAADPEDPDNRRFFAPIKNNLGPAKPGLAFGLETVTLEANGYERVVTSKVVWEPNPISLSANDIMAAGSADPEERGALEECMAWVECMLVNADGHATPMTAKDLIRQASEAGHSDRTLKRARKALNVQAVKEKERWMVSLGKRRSK